MVTECKINPVSSRVCEHGTRSCIVPHESRGELPLPLCTFRVLGGQVNEITWTSEDDVIRAKRWNTSEEATLVARRWLRAAGKQGLVTARRNPEHGYWEYGPQWRAKDFDLRVDAAQAAHLLGG